MFETSCVWEERGDDTYLPSILFVCLHTYLRRLLGGGLDGRTDRKRARDELLDGWMDVSCG